MLEDGRHCEAPIAGLTPAGESCVPGCVPDSALTLGETRKAGFLCIPKGSRSQGRLRVKNLKSKWCMTALTPKCWRPIPRSA